MNKLALLLAVGDFLLVILAYYSGVILRLGGLSPLWTDTPVSLVQIIALGGILVLTSSIFELYSRHRSLSRSSIIARIVFSLALAFLFLASIFYMFPEIVVGRGVLLVTIFFYFSDSRSQSEMYDSWCW